MPPGLSVVICSLNGAGKLGRCLQALRSQTIYPDLEVIVVDDGSSDGTSEVARSGGAAVIRHDCRRGASAARNTGIHAAQAAVVAFLDDDCEPCSDWAQRLLCGYQPDVVALGGALLAGPERGLTAAYLSQHNPLDPQEIALKESHRIPYRFALYLRRQWRPDERHGLREVASLPTANLSVRHSALLEIGGFDERIIFGAEDDDLCRRLTDAFPAMRLMFDPSARVIHHFEPSLRELVRRSRSYGRASALMYHKWPDVPPTFFPFPSIIMAALILSLAFPPLAVIAVLLPLVFYPLGFRAALNRRNWRFLGFSYLQMIEETADNLGFVWGLWRYRGWFRAGHG